MTKVYIIVCKKDGVIESVWETKQLAKAAIGYHAKQSNVSITEYGIVERQLNYLVQP